MGFEGSLNWKIGNKNGDEGYNSTLGRYLIKSQLAYAFSPSQAPTQSLPQEPALKYRFKRYVALIAE